jgi:hypothetical protein
MAWHGMAWLHEAETCSGRRGRKLIVAYRWTYLILNVNFANDTAVLTKDSDLTIAPH